MASRPEAPFRLNLVKDEPVVRDDRWEITVTNIGDFGFTGKLCVRHRQHGDWDQWPGAEDEAPPAIVGRGYDLEHEVTFPTLGRAMAAALAFLKRYGAGEIEWLEWDVDSQRHVVTQHTARDRMGAGDWKDQPCPIEKLIHARPSEQAHG